MNDEKLQLMMLEVDGILTRCEASATDVLAAAQQLAVSAVSGLFQKQNRPSLTTQAASQTFVNFKSNIL